MLDAAPGGGTAFLFHLLLEVQASIRRLWSSAAVSLLTMVQSLLKLTESMFLMRNCGAVTRQFLLFIWVVVLYIWYKVR